MKIRFISDLHSALNMTYSPTEFVDIMKAKKPADVTLIAGDMDADINEAAQFLKTYFPNERVVFIAGNHVVYNNSNKTIIDLLKDYEHFDGDWKFLENDYMWLNDDIAVIGCIGWTDYKYHDYKEFHTRVDERGRRLDQNGNLLPEDPTKTEEFRNKIKAIWDDETTDYNEKDKLFKELYHSISPDNNERVDTSFKNRVSEEVYNNYIAWQESFGKEGKKEFTEEEYIRYNKRIASKYMNDFRFGRMPDKDPCFGGYRYMNPDDCLKFHNQSKKYIRFAYDKIIEKNPNATIILMTHHPFTTKCIDTKYKGEPLNAAFVSNHDKWLKKFPNIKYLHCGHVHQRFFTDLYDKKVICNPMGYLAHYENLGNINFDINYILNIT